MQGSQDIAVHVGTLHFTCKAVIEAFAGDIHPGDVFAVNDPYVGGTHFNDVRIVRPIFYEGEIIAYAQSNGHWADVGGSVPGSFDVNAKEHFAEGIRIPPVRIWDKGRYLNDVVRLIVSNTRVPADAEGDLHAQASATRVAELEILRLVDKYGDRHDPHGVPGGAGLRRAAHAAARRGAARRRLGDRGLHRLRPVHGRRADPGQGEDDDRGRPALVRPHRLASRNRKLHQRRLRLRLLRRHRRHEDVLPGRAPQLGLLPGGRGRPRARGLGRERAVADRGHRLLRRGLREDHELDLRALVRAAARPRARLLVQSRVPARRRPRRATREPPHLHVVRLDGRRLGRPQRQRRLERHRAHLRRRARGPAARGAGAPLPRPHHRPRDPDRLRWPRPVPRRLRRRERCDPPRGGGDRHVLHVRPRALHHVGHQGRSAVDSARRVADARRPAGLPRSRLLERALRRRRRVHPALRRRRRLRRPAPPRSRSR